LNTYAGIGSRDISLKEQKIIHHISDYMFHLGYVLYSGHSDGSDISFEEICQGFGISFLPWDGFNKQLIFNTIKISDISNDAYDSVSKFHPNPNALKQGALKLMARNYQQICGIFDLPIVDFVIFCANEKNGNVLGGTGQAIRIAKSFGVPCINIRTKDWKEQIQKIPKVEPSSKDEILKCLKQNSN
jgi:hypothetical protein